MKKRELYQLKLTKHTEGDFVTVTRTDNNYGTQGYVCKNGNVIFTYTPRQIPNYIIEEAFAMMKVTDVRIKRIYR